MECIYSRSLVQCFYRVGALHRVLYHIPYLALPKPRTQVHGTSNARVSRNVAYDISGSAYYLEDGVETGQNLIL